MKEKQFIGTCVENPFGRVEELVRVVENGIEISKRTFLNHCYVHPDTIKEMRDFPYDFTYYKSDKIYFYEWSAIEHFYL